MARLLLWEWLSQTPPGRASGSPKDDGLGVRLRVHWTSQTSESCVYGAAQLRGPFPVSAAQGLGRVTRLRTTKCDRQRPLPPGVVPFQVSLGPTTPLLQEHPGSRVKGGVP